MRQSGANITRGNERHFDMTQMALQLDNFADIVQSAIAPAILLAAVLMQLRVLNNRLSRIVDRHRWLRFNPAGPDAPAMVAEQRHETEVLLQRRRAMNRAIFLCASAGLAVCCLIAVLFIDATLQAGLAALVAMLFVLGMACLVGSYLFFLEEIFLSMRKLKLTIRGSRHLSR